MSRSHDFDEDRLSRAIAATFERRGTAIPFDAPVALTQIFATDAGKQRQWAAFVRDLAIEIPVFDAVVADLAGFLMPYARHARQRS